MSMHKKPLTDIERDGLKKHGLAIDKPSMLSDAFRLGVAWALEQQVEQQPIATLLVTMHAHDMGQSLAPRPPDFKFARAIAHDAAKALPVGEYKLYAGAAPAAQPLVDAQPRSALAQQGEPVFWYRPRSDGIGYEGPIHNENIERVRKLSGVWVPLFAGSAQSAQPVQEKTSTVDYCTDPDNCKRCKTHPAHRGEMTNAGIGVHPWDKEAPVAQPVYGDREITKLPHDVVVGGNTFRAGVSLEAFVKAAQSWHRAAYPQAYGLTQEQKDANFSRLLAAAHQPDARKVIEQMVEALEATTSMLDNLNSAYGSDEVDAVSKEGRAAIQAGQQWL